MESLVEKYQQKLRFTKTAFVRGAMHEIDWRAKLIGIKGARGVGKTTLMLQYIKLNLQDAADTALYVSLDDIWFSEHRLVDLADDFVKQGGKYLFLDEVHKYPNWAQELKNIYDDHHELKVVFTGSSLLEILNVRADLSRRAVIYHMQGLSFREYVSIEHKQSFSTVSLEDILLRHTEMANGMLDNFRPLQYFPSYLKSGYYPFYQEVPELYMIRLEEVINMMLEIELPLLRGMDLAYVTKIKQLLLVIAESAPFVPNVSKISEKIGINRTTLLLYLHYLEEIGLTFNLTKSSQGITRLQKPNKIYVENTNLAYALGKVSTGNLRETFFINQVSHSHQVHYADPGDFKVDGIYTIEIGGKDKSGKQIQNIPNAFIASDNIETGYQQKIPLWLFGFLY